MDIKKKEALSNLISIIALIYSVKSQKKISVHTLYKYIIDWVYYGKYNTFFESLFVPLTNKTPIWYSGFNYDVNLLKELNEVKHKMNGYSDWELKIIHDIKNTSYSQIENKDEWVFKKPLDDHFGGPSSKYIKPFYDVYSELYTKVALNRLKNLKQSINSFLNIDKQYYNKSYFLRTELPTINKFNTTNIPLNIYSKKGCKDISNFIKKKYPNIHVNCIDCTKGNLKNCFKEYNQRNPTNRKKTQQYKKRNLTKKRNIN